MIMFVFWQISHQNLIRWGIFFYAQKIAKSTILGYPRTKNGLMVGESYIQGIMDDHSRYIVSARCYLEDTASNFRKTLFYAIEHHHIPHMIIVDNGGPYVDKDLIDLCKRLGIALVHTRANDGAGKGALLYEYYNYAHIFQIPRYCGETYQKMCA